MKELKFEELSIKLKLGLTYTALACGCSEFTPERKKWILDMIKERALGAVWPVPKTEGIVEFI